MKRTGLKKLFILFIILAGSGVLFAQDYLNDNRTLMEIGDEKVSVAEFMRVYQKNNVQGEVLDQKSIDDYLDLYINFKLKVKEAEDIGMDTVQSFIDELEGYRKQLTKPYFIDENVNEELVKEAYERKLVDIRASHILIKVEEDASPEDTLKAYNKVLEIRKKAAHGEDFAELAIEYSNDPSARDMKDKEGKKVVRLGNRGDLGYFSVFDMVYPFENAAFNTEVGTVSDIVRTRFGYHILKVMDKKEAMGTAQVAHIFLRADQAATTEDSEKMKETIFKAYEELQNGETFETIVAKYSDDRGSKQNGGLLPEFNSNKMVPEFIYQISLLDEPADYSEPFTTQYGWHIIKLVKRERPGSFDEEKEALKERVKKDVRAHKSRQAVIEKIKKDYRFKAYKKNFKKFIPIVDSTFLTGEWKADKAEGMNKKLFKIGKQKYTQEDFAEYIENNQGKSNKSIEVGVKKLYKDYVDKSCIAYLDERLEELYPDFGLLMKEYRDGILLFELTDDKVWSKAVEDTTGLNAFYEDYKNSYIWGERVDAVVYMIEKPEFTQQIINDLNNGLLTSQLIEKFNSDSLTVFSYDKEIFSKGDNKNIDQVEWKVGVYELSDENDNPVVIEIRKKLEPQPKTLNEARGLVIADYQNYLEKEWIDYLKTKYTIKIHDKVLSSIKKY